MCWQIPHILLQYRWLRESYLSKLQIGSTPWGSGLFVCPKNGVPYLWYGTPFFYPWLPKCDRPINQGFLPLSRSPKGGRRLLKSYLVRLFEHWQGLRVLQSNILDCVLCVDLRKTKNTSFLLRALLHTLSRAISPTLTDQFQSRIISPTAPHQDYTALLSVLSRQFSQPRLFGFEVDSNSLLTLPIAFRHKILRGLAHTKRIFCVIWGKGKI